MAGLLIHSLIGLVGAFFLNSVFPGLVSFFPSVTLFYIVSIVWALIPDIPILWKNSTFDDKKIMNIFWFHYWIDRNMKERNVIF